MIEGWLIGDKELAARLNAMPGKVHDGLLRRLVRVSLMFWRPRLATRLCFEEGLLQGAHGDLHHGRVGRHSDHLDFGIKTKMQIRQVYARGKNQLHRTERATIENLVTFEEPKRSAHPVTLYKGYEQFFTIQSAMMATCRPFFQEMVIPHEL